jgi:1-acyl-sn-glycerol-3-phosphate acyltransferase
MLDRLARSARVDSVGRMSPWGLRLFRGPLRWLANVAFRGKLVGLELLPTDRPYLLVSNHSGGGAAEIGVLIARWVEDEPRPITGLAHPILFHLPAFGWLLRQVGAVPSTYERALAALADGVPVLVFPGGDHEAMRPVWQANRVDFNGRKGFLRIAREAWVPIVPLGIRGSHYTLPFLARSTIFPWIFVFPRLLGIKRMGISISGVLGSAAIVALAGPHFGYGWAAAVAWFFWLGAPPAALIPVLPWPIRCRLGAPIAPADLFGSKGDDGPLDDAYAQVVGAVQALVLD